MCRSAKKRKIETDVVYFYSGDFFLKKMKDALLNHQKQHEQHEGVITSIPASKRASWDVLIDQWEKDHTKLDPYDDIEQCLCLSFVLPEQ